MPHDHLRKAAAAWLVEREQLDQLAAAHAGSIESDRIKNAERLVEEHPAGTPQSGG